MAGGRKAWPNKGQRRRVSHKSKSVNRACSVPATASTQCGRTALRTGPPPPPRKITTTGTGTSQTCPFSSTTSRPSIPVPAQASRATSPRKAPSSNLVRQDIRAASSPLEDGGPRLGPAGSRASLRCLKVRAQSSSLVLFPAARLIMARISNSLPSRRTRHQLLAHWSQVYDCPEPIPPG
jgi:hypothetical protein